MCHQAIHHLHRQFPGVTQFHKGGQPKPPEPPAPPVATSAADNASAAYREMRRRRGMGFSNTILTGGMSQQKSAPAPGKTLLGS